MHGVGGSKGESSMLCQFTCFAERAHHKATTQQRAAGLLLVRNRSNLFLVGG